MRLTHYRMLTPSVRGSGDLCRCSCVSRAWRDAAARDALWRAQLLRELHRPPRRLAAARRSGDAASAAGSARVVFEAAMEEPALQHKAWQARFHAAMALLPSWRATVVLRASSAGPGAPGDAAPERVWRCFATSLQHHQQSAWVKFSLPPALAADAGVVAGCREGRLVSGTKHTRQMAVASRPAMCSPVRAATSHMLHARVAQS